MVAVLVEIVTARPCEDEKAEEAQQEQKAGFGRLVQLYIRGVIQFYFLVVILGVH